MSDSGRVSAAAIIGSLLCALLSAQAPQLPPVFRSEVDVVAVDVSVVDAKGRPIPDLRTEELTVTVDGRPRRLASAEFISLASDRPASALSSTAASPYSSNEGARPGRLITIVVDEGNIRFGGGRAAMAAASRFLDQLTPSDKVALISIPNGVAIDFSANHAVIRDGLQRVLGRADQIARSGVRVSLSEAFALEENDLRLWGDAVLRECDLRIRDALERELCSDMMYADARRMVESARQTSGELLGALRAIFEALAKIEAQKTLILISEGLAVGSPGGLGATGDMQWIVRSAATARVSVYVMHLLAPMFDASDSGLPSATPFQDEGIRRNGLEQLAGMTRGALFRVAGTGDNAFQQIASETSGYYLIGFEPEREDRDGKPHRIRVQVARSGATVRSRTEFTAPVARKAEQTAQELVMQTLRAPMIATGLSLRTSTYTLRDRETDKLRVILTARIDRGVKAPGELAIGFHVTDPSGRLAASGFDRPILNPVGQGDEASYTFATAALLEPGRYTAKLAVLDGNGRTGSIEHHFTANVETGDGLGVSELLLFDNANADPNETMRPTADGTITGPYAAGYFEIYPQAALPRDAQATIEAAVSPEGPALVSARVRVAAQPDRRDPKRTRFLADGTLGVQLLPPGDYFVRATVSSGSRPLAATTRPVRIVRDSTTVVTRPDTVPRIAAIFAADHNLLRPFARASVLRPDVVSFFLTRMADADALIGPDVRAAAESARGERFDEVVPLLSRAGNDRLSATFLRGLALLARGDLEPAAEQFRASLRASSEFLPAAFYLGACYAAGGKDRQAVGAWQTSLVSESDARIIYEVLADALLRLNEPERAQAIVREAQDTWKDDEAFAPRLAAAYAIAKKPAEALEALNPYLEKHPEDVEALFLAMRLIYDAHSARSALRTPTEDLSLISKYAQDYARAKGPHQPIVAQWVKFVGERREAGGGRPRR
jgi:VWFA-related protein